MDQAACDRQNGRRGSSDATATQNGAPTASAHGQHTSAHAQPSTAPPGPLYVASAAWRREPRLLYLSTLGYAAVPEAREEQELQAALAASISAAAAPIAGTSAVTASLASSSSSSASSSSTLASSRQGSNASSSSLPESSAATGAIIWSDEPPSYTELVAMEGRSAEGPPYYHERSGAVSSVPIRNAPESNRSADRNAPLASPPKKTSSFGFIKKRLSLGSSGSSP